MRKKLILIDGSSVLSTSFFGNLPREFYNAKTDGDKEKVLEKVMKTSDGRFTNGVYTMTKILLNILKNQNPTHIAICWDVNRNSLERRKRYDGYKANRQETIPALGSQFGLMQELLKEMNVPQFKLEGHEADDIIGTFAKSFENEMPTYILTKDQDALQLITEKTRVWLTTSKFKELYESRGLNPKDLLIPDGVFEYTPLSFEEEYGLKPIQIIDLKALEGDKSDNIPGVKNVGPAAILPLLNEYGTVEGIYEVIENTPEKELKVFFKEELGISRSPISNLLKKTNVEIAEEIQTLIEKDFNKSLVKEVITLFKEVDDKEFKEKVKTLNEKDEILFKEITLNLSEQLKEIDSGIVGKEAAFLSKELATIKTNLTEFQNVKLDDLSLKFNKENAKKKFEELEFKSLLEKL